MFDRFLPCKDKNDQRETIIIAISRAGNFNISDNLFPIAYEFSARPK